MPSLIDEERDAETLCVVENIRDVIAVEHTGQYKGLYHVLGGIISPMDGVGPQDLFLADLPERITKEGIKEVILALSTTMEGRRPTSISIVCSRICLSR